MLNEAGLSANGEAKFSSLAAVSCTSATACSAGGSAAPGSGTEGTATLAERYE